MTAFRLTIGTPNGILLDREVLTVTLKTEAGVTALQTRHADLLAPIQFTHVRVKTSEGLEKYIVRGGIITMDHDSNTASILVSFAEELSETASVTAEEYVNFLESEIAKGHSLSSFHLEYLEEEHFVLKKQLQG